jgi:hypothetical protein
MVHVGCSKPSERYPIKTLQSQLLDNPRAFSSLLEVSFPLTFPRHRERRTEMRFPLRAELGFSLTLLQQALSSNRAQASSFPLVKLQLKEYFLAQVSLEDPQLALPPLVADFSAVKTRPISHQVDYSAKAQEASLAPPLEAARSLIIQHPYLEVRTLSLVVLPLRR